MLSDSDQRQQAIDPHGSYIVQAPAGSGKTEILTQRYLRLLSGVSAPEQIIALTFTRKAANEMRERILLALQQAAEGTGATSSHQQQTLAFATDALARDKALGWQLLKQPSRLRVITIDSLCQSITQAIPIQEKQVPYAHISDKPKSHYLAAARACLAYAVNNDDFIQPIKVLLTHVDNRQDTLLTLFSDLLAARDQWLQPLFQAREQEKSAYEHALFLIEQHELNRLLNSIPADCADELMTLTQRLALIDPSPRSPRAPLQNWHCFNQLDRPLANSLALLLVTSQNTLRKAFDHHVGLKRGECPDTDYHELKARSKELLSRLDESPDFLQALLRVKNLPAPHYDPEQWDVLQALFALLPLLAAHLHVVFREHNEVDFTAISQQALQALGDEENPTDLALYLDHSIHHLLVDEFQDTSIQQFQLLLQLVQNWQPNDGKTLFIVGDPMQSIYRFRAAEVGLFLRAKQQGVGPVTLTPLELRCNFRSTDTLIDWVNHRFQFIFPQKDDMESGAISFHQAVSIRNGDSNSFVLAFQYENRILEAHALVKRAKIELENNPTDNIAILVRGRGQLADIVSLLRAQKIPFQGVDIDLLAHLPHLNDVWSLTQALLMPANRLVWLSLLRSPLCGISLADLHAIANFAKNKSLYYALSQATSINGLSLNGRLRAEFIYSVLNNALACRHQQSLITWIKDTLSHLHLEKILDASQQDDLEQYWLLLEQFERDGQIEDMPRFKEELNKLYSQRVIPSRLKIMTIHKSKGLEFDCVLLPGLGSKPARPNTPMLRWLKLPSLQHGELLLVSPIKAAHHEHCLLYDYLGKLDAQKNSYELQRLLYVAVTRAKKRLYLFDHSETVTEGTFRHLLQRQDFITEKDDGLSAEDHEPPRLPELYHLPSEFYQNSPPLLPIQASLGHAINTNHTARLIGIVAHELLQWICDHHPTTTAVVPWELAWNQLKTFGFAATEFEQAKYVLTTQIAQLFADPIGQWIIKKQEDERNEYEFLIDHHGDIAFRIIDRTFLDQGLRWIIDFKTGQEDKKSQEHHHQQLNDYAKLFAERSIVPIRCGLYYLASNHWVAWPYEGSRISEAPAL